MQAVHDHRATYPLIKKPTNRLLLTFSPDFALNSQIWLFYADFSQKAWYFAYSYSVHCRAVPFCYGPKTGHSELKCCIME